MTSFFRSNMVLGLAGKRALLNAACLMLLTALPSAHAASAADNYTASHADLKLPVLLSPSPGVSARVEQQGRQYVLIQPQGQRLTLMSEDDLMEGEPMFGLQDYDYDGHPDLSIGASAGMVNIEDHIWLYDVQANAYRALVLPESVTSRQNCEGFWDIERLVDRQAVKSQCRGGPRWFYDVLQIESDHSVWISEQNKEPVVMAQWPMFEQPMRAVTYDRQGNVLSETVPPISDSGEDTDWVVPAKRLPLYSEPDMQATTKGYLIKGDKTTMLAFKGQEWMQIAYQGKQGRIERWVRLQDAYGAH